MSTHPTRDKVRATLVGLRERSDVVVMAEVGKAMETIYHIITRDEWAEAREAGVYIPESLSTDGFIHAGFRIQLLDVANALFRGEQDLVVLCIDPSRVMATIREDAVEFPEGHVSLHPHFYGPLNIDAVFRVVDFPPEPDGSFRLPEDLV